MSTVGEAAPLKNKHGVTIKLQVLSFNKTDMTDCRNLNERVSLKAVTALVPTKLPLLEPLFEAPLWGKALKGSLRAMLENILPNAALFKIGKATQRTTLKTKQK